MPVVRPYPIGEVDARPIPNVALNVAAAGDVGLFGGNQARDLQQAGQNLDRTSDITFNIYERAAKEANDTKVESDLNGFIDRKQKTLADFVQLKGQDAIQGSKAVNDGLLTMKTQLLDGAKNAYQRDSLSRRLDAQLLDATGTVTAHVANQSTVWQTSTLAARGDLIDRDATMKRDDPNALDGQLAAKATVGQETARLKYGAAPDSEIAKVEVLKEQEKLLVGVLQAKINDGNKRAALALYDKYSDILKHNAGVDSVMKGVRTEIDGENVVNSALTKVGLPPVRSGETGGLIQKRQDMTGRLQQSGFSPAASAGIAANFEHESEYRSTATNPKDGSDGSDSIGLGQWNGSRAKALIQFAKNKGVSPENADAQIGYMKAELSGEIPFSISGIKPDLKARLDQTKTPEEAAALLSREYFKPRAVTEAKSRADTASAITPGNVFKGDLKAGFDQASVDIQNRTDLSPEVRSSALATLSKQASTVTSFQAASLKALKDEADAYRLNSYLSPTGADPAKMASFADRAAALGEQALAGTYRVLAAVAPTATNTLQSMPADQLKLLKSMEEGPAKKLIEGIESGQGETLAKANDAFEKLKKAQASGLDPAGLKDMATNAANLYAAAGKSDKAREVAQTYGMMTAAGGVLQTNPVAQKEALAELEGIASQGQINEQQATLHGMLKTAIPAQAAEFQKDAYSAGRKLYGMPALSINDGAGRTQQAADIARRRGLLPSEVAPMSDEEFTALRSQAAASPQAAQKLFQDIASSYPPEAIPLIGAGIAGKGLDDPVSRGHAAALSFFADKEPDVAATILDGVSKRKTMGDALRDMPKSDVFYQAVQDKMGNAFKSLPGRTPALIVSAAEAIYTSKMVTAGRQGEKALDDTVFNQALDAVIGKPITLPGRGGQSLVPPKGVDTYQFDTALGTLLPLDLPGELRTMNGSMVTAEKIARYGMLSNSGKDGQYFVEMPDPARGDAPAYVQLPDGKPYILDIKPLIERAKRAGMEMNFPGGAQTGAGLPLEQRLPVPGIGPR